jgi:hypothetical protein
MARGCANPASSRKRRGRRGQGRIGRTDRPASGNIETRSALGAPGNGFAGARSIHGRAPAMKLGLPYWTFSGERHQGFCRFDLLRLLQGFLGHVFLLRLVRPGGDAAFICKHAAKVHDRTGEAQRAAFESLRPYAKRHGEGLRAPHVEFVSGTLRISTSQSAGRWPASQNRKSKESTREAYTRAS